jgi:O-antigen/teichoic acid export membrane protein
LRPITHNLIANYVGKLWAGLLNLVLIPVYIRYIGIEAFGLIGFMMTLQGTLMIFDMGLSATLNRELARYTVMDNKNQEMRNLVRTLEVIYWVLAGLVGLLVVLLSPMITAHWLNVKTLPVSIVQKSIMLMGFALVFQMPVSLYTGGLMGLQRQVAYNVLHALVWTIRAVGALFVVLWSSQPILGFFYWQLFASIINVAIIAIALWHYLPIGTTKDRFRRKLIGHVWKFAAGMSFYSIIVLIFNQIDKIFLSKQLSLDIFGYYNLAWQIVGVLYLFYIPIYSAYYPAFSQHVALGDIKGLAHHYHQGCQLMSVVILPIVVTISFFAPEILFIWTQDLLIVQNTHILLSLLMIGAAFGALIYLPFSVVQAFGQTRIVVFNYLFALVILIPMMFWGFRFYGVVGAACAWVIVNAGQAFIMVHLIHKRLLPQEYTRWLIEDIAQPLVAAVIVAIIARLILPKTMHILSILACLAIITSITFLASACATSTSRQLLNRFIPLWRSQKFFDC